MDMGRETDRLHTGRERDRLHTGRERETGSTQGDRKTDPHRVRTGDIVAVRHQW